MTGVTLQDMENARLDTITLAEIANSREGGVFGGNPITETETRLGDTIKTAQGQINNIGFTANNVNALRAFTVVPYDVVYIIKGHTDIDDGGGGGFSWDPTSTAADNNGTIIKATTISIGRWFRQDQTPVNVRWFGATGNGVTNDTVAIQAAIHSLIMGGVVHVPAGNYLISGGSPVDSYSTAILIPADETYVIYGDGEATTITISGTDTIGFRCTSSNSTIEAMQFSSVSGVGSGNVGIGLVPEDMTQTTTVVAQDYNVIKSIRIQNSTIGILLAAGPDVTGSDSSCFYNRFTSVTITLCPTNIKLIAGTNAGSSGPNRNQFLKCVLGGTTTTGIDIESGGTNSFIGCTLEGIAVGVGEAIHIEAVDVNGVANNENSFVACKFESNTLDVYNDAVYTDMYGCNPTTFDGVETPLIVSGNSPSQTPQKLNGLFYQTNSQIAGFDNDWMYNTAVNGLRINKTIKALTSAGLQLFEDGGTGITIADGGFVGMAGVTSPTHALELARINDEPVFKSIVSGSFKNVATNNPSHVSGVTGGSSASGAWHQTGYELIIDTTWVIPGNKIVTGLNVDVSDSDASTLVPARFTGGDVICSHGLTLNGSDNVVGLTSSATDLGVSYWNNATGKFLTSANMTFTGGNSLNLIDGSNNLSFKGNSLSFSRFTGDAFIDYGTGGASGGHLNFRSTSSNTSVLVLRDNGNIGIGMTSFGNGAKVLGMADATAPSGTPSGGGIVYVESGALKFKGSSGTITTLGIP